MRDHSAAGERARSESDRGGGADHKTQERPAPLAFRVAAPPDRPVVREVVVAIPCFRADCVREQQPMRLTAAARCGGPTGLSQDGTITSAKIELVAGYATSLDVALHEVGHMLSLLRYSSNTTNVKYYRMNDALFPSNTEAAVVVVLYANPPGATMREIGLPTSAAQAASAAVSLGAWVGISPRVSAITGAPLTPGGELSWWSELLCRFAILAPLCEGAPLIQLGL
jgi:hypothetical protein